MNKFQYSSIIVLLCPTFVIVIALLSHTSRVEEDKNTQLPEGVELINIYQTAKKIARGRVMHISFSKYGNYDKCFIRKSDTLVFSKECQKKYLIWLDFYKSVLQNHTVITLKQ